MSSIRSEKYESTVLNNPARMKSIPKCIYKIILVLTFFLGALSPLQAAPGSLDPTFGQSGKVILRFGDRGDSFSGVALQQDGKIVAAGRNGNGKMIVARYGPDGALDNPFGNGGIFISGLSSFHFGSAIALQPDGKILVCGKISLVINDDAFLVVRLTSAGQLDSTFNGTGMVQTNLSPGSDIPRDIAIQSDGKIVLTGAVGLAGQAISDIGLVRYNPDGSLDATFGNGGTLIVSINQNAEQGHALKIQQDGKLLVFADSLNFDAQQGSLLLLRFETNGSPDQTFGIAGISTTDLGSDVFSSGDLALQTDGKIVVTASIGSNSTFEYAFTVARYTSAGAPDTGFGANGKTVVVQNSANSAESLVIQPDGKIISAGQAAPTGTALDILLTRLNPDGTLDQGFGNGGRAFTTVGNGSDYCFDIALQPDGKIVAAGDFNVVGLFDYDAVLLRFLGDPANAVKPPFDFDGDGKTDVSVFRPSAGEWWYLRSSDGISRAFQFGQGTDKIAAADYTGDGKADLAFWRPASGEWFILRSEDSSFYSFPFGGPGDTPAPADFDGDGKSDPAIFRPSSATWFILNSSGGTTIQTFGTNGDRPVPADYDGDGKADLAIFRPSDGTWWLNRSQAGLIVLNFGTGTDKTVPGDYTGDGKADVAFFRPSSNEWFISRSEDFSFYSFPFGAVGDIPAPGDYDGDGKTDPTVFRQSNSTWFKLQSTSGFEAITFGSTGDIPVPSAFVR